MSQEWKEPAVGDDVQAPLGAGGEAAPAEEYAPPRQRFNTSTLALVAAFAAALIVLYFLGLQNKPRIASADEQAKAREIDSKIEKYRMNMEDQKGARPLGDGLLERLQGYFGWKVVAPDLKGNPFEHLVPKAPEPTAVVLLDPVIPPPVMEVEDPVLKEVARDFAGLKLQMVMLGNPCSAMINNQMAAVGTKFNHLTVTDIQTDRVMLTYENKAGEKKVFALRVNGSGGDTVGGFGGPKPR